MRPNEALFTPVQRIAAEVGCNAQTITRRPKDFFPLTKIGGQWMASTSVYRDWLRQRLAETSADGDASRAA